MDKIGYGLEQVKSPIPQKNPNFGHRDRIMEAIRKKVTVRDNHLTVELPDSFNDKKVELIILPAEEAKLSEVQEPKVDYYKKFYSSMKTSLSINEIDEQLRALRSEWDRDIS